MNTLIVGCAVDAAVESFLCACCSWLIGCYSLLFLLIIVCPVDIFNSCRTSDPDEALEQWQKQERSDAANQKFHNALTAALDEIESGKRKRKAADSDSGSDGDERLDSDNYEEDESVDEEEEDEQKGDENDERVDLGGAGLVDEYDDVRSRTLLFHGAVWFL